jgi:acyl-CoA hydrolase
MVSEIEHILKGKSPEASATVMTEVVYPHDANPIGMLHGGRLVQWMDTASAITAQLHSEKICATVALDKMIFKKPATVGEIILIKAKITRAFDTSMEVLVQAWARKAVSTENHLINIGFFTFVALDDAAQPARVPPIIPNTQEEMLWFEQALQRKTERRS